MCIFNVNCVYFRCKNIIDKAETAKYFNCVLFWINTWMEFFNTNVSIF